MNARTRHLYGILVVLSLAATGGACGGDEVRTDDGQGVRPLPKADSRGRGAGEQELLAFLPSGRGVEYDRAVARMVRANHLLEQRQADLFFAREEGAPVEVIADLRREVAALERSYAAAIVAMAATIRCEASYCPEGGLR